MSRPRPKFCVGEEVVCRLGVGEITRREWFRHGATAKGLGYRVVGGWWYWIGAFDKTFLERRLRKLPPEERNQWEDCAWQPIKQGVEA